MFQYNLYSLLKEMYPNTEVKADITWFNTNDEHHGFELKRIFGNVQGSEFEIREASICEIYRTTGQIPTPAKSTLGRMIRPVFGHINRRLREAGKCEDRGTVLNQFEAKIDHDTLCNLDTGRDWHIFGFFIEEIYYRDRTDRLKKELVFPELTGENARIAAKMETEESVSIHVRRGDYLSQTYSGRFLCLDRSYYEPAVDIVRQHLNDPKFYIFSEDPEYVEKAFDWLPEKTIVNINTGNDSYKDMQLMTKCKANIIANSTFSQWASILNENTDHITVYPARYMSGEDTEDRKMSGWIRVD